MPYVLVPPQVSSVDSTRSVPCSMRCTGRPRPIPNDDSTSLNGIVVAPSPTGPGGRKKIEIPPVKGVGEPCAGEPHARFDGRGLETERYGVTAPAPDPTNLPGCPSTWCSAIWGKSPEMTLRYAATLAATAEAEFLKHKKIGAHGIDIAISPADILDMTQLSQRTPMAYVYCRR